MKTNNDGRKKLDVSRKELIKKYAFMKTVVFARGYLYFSFERRKTYDWTYSVSTY